MAKLQFASIPTSALLALITTVSMASAQDGSADITGSTYWNRRIPAPTRALELTLGTGYAQGFGDLQQGSALNDTAQAGMSVDLGAAYRLTPRWALGVAGGYQFYDAGDNSVGDSWPRGATGRVEASYHFEPFSRLDPWLAFGAGYRYLGERNQPGGNAHLHGLELASLNAGFDLRVDRQLGIAPLIGAGLDTFLWDGSSAIDDPRLSAFLFAGLRVRLDLGPSYETQPATLAAR
jgi:hypothetical protein